MDEKAAVELNPEIHAKPEVKPFWAWDVATYTSNRGFQIIERAYGGAWPEGVPKPKYMGVGAIQRMVPHPMTGQPIPDVDTFTFALPVKDLEEGFMRFEAFLRPAAEKRIAMLQQQEAKQSIQIARPDQVPKGPVKMN